MKRDLRYARDICYLIKQQRDLALQGDATNAVMYLSELQPQSKPFKNVAADFVELQRQLAVNEVIAYLRVQTGKDFGTNFQAWISEYGDAVTKANNK